MDRDTLEVTANAVQAAKIRGVEGDIASRVLRMAKRSAICTHPFGNRRFDGYVLNVVGSQIIDVRLIDEDHAYVTH